MVSGAPWYYPDLIITELCQNCNNWLLRGQPCRRPVGVNATYLDLTSPGFSRFLSSDFSSGESRNKPGIRPCKDNKEFTVILGDIYSILDWTISSLIMSGLTLEKQCILNNENRTYPPLPRIAPTPPVKLFLLITKFCLESNLIQVRVVFVLLYYTINIDR